MKRLRQICYLTVCKFLSKFKLNYNMDKTNMSPTELIKELRNAEHIIKPMSVSLISHGPSNGPKGKPLQFKKIREKSPYLTMGTKARRIFTLKLLPRGNALSVASWKKDCPKLVYKATTGMALYLKSLLQLDLPSLVLLILEPLTTYVTLCIGSREQGDSLRESMTCELEMELVYGMKHGEIYLCILTIRISFLLRAFCICLTSGKTSFQFLNYFEAVTLLISILMSQQ